MNEISPEPTEQHTSLGLVLASARKEANLTIESVADRLKLSPKQITQLEQDDYLTLGPTTFVKGYIKAYCSLLKLDHAQTLTLFHAPDNVTEKKRMQSFSRRTEKEANDSRLMLVTYLISAAVLGSSGFMYWQATSNESEVIVPEVNNVLPQSEQSTSVQKDTLLEPDYSSNKPVNTQPLMLPQDNGLTQYVGEASTESAEQITEPNKENVISSENVVMLSTIVMRFNDDSWVEIFDASSERIAFGVKKSGYTMTVQGVAPFSVVLGRHQFVNVELDGQSIDLSSLPRNRSAKFKLPLSE